MAKPDATNERNVLRYDAAIATLVGVLALLVSAYTAYEQRQQVRAQVWPILEVTMGNSPIRLQIANKGVGPALVRDVIVRADGKPVKNWDELMVQLLGPGEYGYFTYSINDRVIAAGETYDFWKPHEHDKGNDLYVGDDKSLGARVYEARKRALIEICYCSTLEECWTLVTSATRPPVTTPVRRCPARSAASFEQ